MPQQPGIEVFRLCFSCKRFHRASLAAASLSYIRARESSLTEELQQSRREATVHVLALTCLYVARICLCLVYERVRTHSTFRFVRLAASFDRRIYVHHVIQDIGTSTTNYTPRIAIHSPLSSAACLLLHADRLLDCCVCVSVCVCMYVMCIAYLCICIPRRHFDPALLCWEHSPPYSWGAVASVVGLLCHSSRASEVFRLCFLARDFIVRVTLLCASHISEPVSRL